MSIDPFPERVVARKMCQRNGTINSSIPLGKLQRLSEYLHDNHGLAEVCLSFDSDENGIDRLSGTVHATVKMQCQRCLEAVRVELASEFILRIAEDEANAREIAEQFGTELEVVSCIEDQLDLLAVLEDELIMDLPIVASHDDDNCSDRLNQLKQSAEKAVPKGQGNIQGLEQLAALKEELKKKT